MRAAWIAWIGVMLLGACVTGGTQSVPLSTTVTVTAQQTLQSRLEEMSETEVMPSDAVATYSGYLAANAQFSDASDVLFVAPIGLIADFRTDRLTGGFAGAVRPDGGEITAEGTLTGGAISGADLAAGLGGTLTLGDESHEIDGALAGIFRELDAAALTADVSGVLRQDGLLTGAIDGQIWAERHAP